MMKRVIALGFFDGVHLGHAGLLEMARKRADELHVLAAVMTFDRHPGTVLTGRPTPLLTSPEDREFLMKRMYGMDEVFFLHFDRAMAALPWQEFVEEWLLQDLGVCHVVCGEDFRFGARGEGCAALLREYCRERGVGFDEIPEISLDGVPIHSTLVRELLQAGRMEEAAAFLGHPHCLGGRVISGKRLGRTIGVPTANVLVPPGVLTLPFGVYASRVTAEGRVYEAVTNVGDCPTVTSGGPTVVEPWLLDFSGDLYGREIRIYFYKKLRKEQKFPSLAALQTEIQRNAEQTRAYFAAHPALPSI